MNEVIIIEQNVYPGLATEFKYHFDYQTLLDNLSLNRERLTHLSNDEIEFSFRRLNHMVFNFFEFVETPSEKRKLEAIYRRIVEIQVDRERKNIYNLKDFEDHYVNIFGFRYEIIIEKTFIEVIELGKIGTINPEEMQDENVVGAPVATPTPVIQESPVKKTEVIDVDPVEEDEELDDVEEDVDEEIKPRIRKRRAVETEEDDDEDTEEDDEDDDEDTEEDDEDDDEEDDDEVEVEKEEVKTVKKVSNGYENSLGIKINKDSILVKEFKKDFDDTLEEQPFTEFIDGIQTRWDEGPSKKSSDYRAFKFFEHEMSYIMALIEQDTGLDLVNYIETVDKKIEEVEAAEKAKKKEKEVKPKKRVKVIKKKK